MKTTKKTSIIGIGKYQNPRDSDTTVEPLGHLKKTCNRCYEPPLIQTPSTTNIG